MRIGIREIMWIPKMMIIAVSRDDLFLWQAINEQKVTIVPVHDAEDPRPVVVFGHCGHVCRMVLCTDTPHAVRDFGAVTFVILSAQIETRAGGGEKKLPEAGNFGDGSVLPVKVTRVGGLGRLGREVDAT